MERSILLPGPCASAERSAIFVKGLGKGVTERCMAGHFAQFGTMIECQVSLPDVTSCLPTPFPAYASSAAALKC